MNKKITILLAIVIVLAIAITAGALTDNSDEDTTAVYFGNGGTWHGVKEIRSSEPKIIDNYFTNGDKQFINWNTESDGSGTSYKPGDAVPAGVPSLHAQWRDVSGVYHVTNYFGNLSHFTATINGGALGLLTMNEVYSDHANIITLQPKEGIQNLTYDDVAGVFTYDYDSTAYTLTVKLTGATGIVSEVDGGNAVIGFKATSDVSIDLVEKIVR